MRVSGWIVAAVIVGVSLVGGAAVYIWSESRTSFKVSSVLPPPAPKSGSQRELTDAELGQYDGRAGRDCYVAVDGTVYEIEQGRMWKDGQHEPSQGKAYCGHDLSLVIGLSPHGKSKLAELTVIGALKN